VPAGATAELVTALAGFKRQALHAARLKLEHPVTGREVEWEAPLPADMAHLIEIMEGDLKAGNAERR
jgi:23S rRNA pseudouridine1911/1915/1917 synthase